jgi:hypothetical protein
MPDVLTRDEVRRRAGIFNIAEAATVIGLEPRLFRYELERGRVSGPSIRIGNRSRRYYTAEDLATIKARLREDKS